MQNRARLRMTKLAGFTRKLTDVLMGRGREWMGRGDFHSVGFAPVSVSAAARRSSIWS